MPDVDVSRAEVQSIYIVFKSCEECAISATARLWDMNSDVVSLPNVEKLIAELWKVNPDLQTGFLEEWQARNKSASNSATQPKLLILRDEEFGHNLIDSGKRRKSDELVNLGPVGKRRFGVKNGDVLAFCKETALLLFQTIAPFSEHPALVGNYETRFELKFNAYRKLHSGLLDLLYRA
ncbi:hypothetical protein GGR95_002872 [Sulfitobacter undariae]|uniref:Uncharacterized protein n=1 Tax=Sulfitobacter undariae TaxID=1563671 RepID=A0A7W6EAU6_9RHOB|nr:hypothetical protein [Sulfitobacter undariae]MBB3995220.1 hypothetical protein [Sulfitobacter undariae]